MREHKSFVIAAVVLLTALICCEVFAMNHDAPRIARWYGDKAAAVSLRFDDSLESHVDYVIPKLNEYGIKAAFMVNPGLDRYKKNKAYWEQQVPRMGHQLGNHTLHHRGAKTPAEADFEIGEVARLLWLLYPDRSRLMVFASGGGGVKWGGNDWETASKEYKELVEKYFLIDLYDGHHEGLSVWSEHGVDEIIQGIRSAVTRHDHHALIFHKVGKPDLIDRLKSIYRGHGLTYDPESFEKIVAFLHGMDNVIWTAPPGDIYKYETERERARLETKSKDSRQISLALTVGTDAKLYDHDLTLVVPRGSRDQVASIRQGSERIERFVIGDRSILVPVRPTSGVIEIRFR